MTKLLPRITLVVLGFFILTSSLHAQYVPEDEETQEPRSNDWKQKFFTGGGFGLQFGNITLLQASPILGYRATDRINLGVGGSYQYFRDNIFQYTANIYGYNAFTQFNLVQGIFLHSEFNRITYMPYLNTSRVGVNALLLGAGYSTAPTGGTGLFFLVLWNALTSDLYPYQNPIIRGGIQVGF